MQMRPCGISSGGLARMAVDARRCELCVIAVLTDVHGLVAWLV